MKPSGPILTLVAGAALASGLVLANLATAGDDTAQVTAAETAPAATTPAATAPAPTPTQAPKKVNATWAGHVDGGGASIAIVAKNGGAVAYVCDGRTIESWQLGTAVDGVLDLAGKGKDRIEGSFGNGRAEGTVKVKGRKWTFEVPAVKKPSGLWRSTSRVRGASIDAGWVVLADGSQVGVVTTDGDPEAAPRLDTTDGTTTFDGTELVAQPVEPRPAS